MIRENVRQLLKRLHAVSAGKHTSLNTQSPLDATVHYNLKVNIFSLFHVSFTDTDRNLFMVNINNVSIFLFRSSALKRTCARRPTPSSVCTEGWTAAQTRWLAGTRSSCVFDTPVETKHRRTGGYAQVGR